MTQFTYLGDHEATTLWGIEFPRGVAVSVEVPEQVMKLRGNAEFSETVDGAEVMPSEPKQKRKYVRKDA